MQCNATQGNARQSKWARQKQNNNGQGNDMQSKCKQCNNSGPAVSSTSGLKDRNVYDIILSILRGLSCRLHSFVWQALCLSSCNPSSFHLFSFSFRIPRWPSSSSQGLNTCGRSMNTTVQANCTTPKEHAEASYWHSCFSTGPILCALILLGVWLFGYALCNRKRNRKCNTCNSNSNATCVAFKARRVGTARASTLKPYSLQETLAIT